MTGKQLRPLGGKTEQLTEEVSFIMSDVDTRDIVHDGGWGTCAKAAHPERATEHTPWDVILEGCRGKTFTVSQLYANIQKAYGPEFLSRTRVHKWCHALVFREIATQVSDEPFTITVPKKRQRRSKVAADERSNEAAVQVVK